MGKDSKPKTYENRCELHSLFILNPDDYERGRMSPMERSQPAHYVWYINYSDTLAGVFFFVENNIYHEDGGGGRVARFL